tara:strand:+ start:332 stop:1132 length:801 start_codon:yes stop_codon:yes gene_type:complete
MKKLLLLSLLVLFGCSKEDNSALIDNYTSQIISLNVQIALLNSEIINLQAEVTNLTNNPIVETITETVTETVVVTVQDNSAVEALESKVSELNNTIATLQAQITALENTQSSTSDTTSDTDNWPDYAAQGHSMSAIGVWTLYSIRGNIVSQSKQFDIKIYPSPNNPNKLDDTSYPQTGLIDFNTHNQLGFYYVYDANSNTGSIRVDSTETDGIDTTIISNEKYFYIIYHFANESEAEKLVINLNINTTDEAIYPDTLINAVFYRTK